MRARFISLYKEVKRFYDSRQMNVNLIIAGSVQLDQLPIFFCVLLLLMFRLCFSLSLHLTVYTQSLIVAERFFKHPNWTFHLMNAVIYLCCVCKCDSEREWETHTEINCIEEASASAGAHSHDHRIRAQTFSVMCCGVLNRAIESLSLSLSDERK